MPEKTLMTEEVKGRVLDDLLTPEVRDFCAQQGILKYVPTAIDLAKQHFSSIQDIYLRLEDDPEAGEEWLMIDVTVHGEVDEVVKSHNDYIADWVSLVPWPERDKVRLSYNIQ